MSTPFPWPNNYSAAISLTFDDARLSQADVGLPLLNELGVKASFYVSFNFLQQRLDVWRQAIADGHEIGNHTLTHPCSGNFGFVRDNALEEYSLERMDKELTDANARIEELLGVTPSTFAYPCGQTYVGRGENFRSYVPLVAKHFRAGRGFNAESMNVPGFCDPAHLFGVDGDNKTTEQLIHWAQSAIDSGQWLILCGHEIGSIGRQIFDTKALSALCEFAKQNNIWIDTISGITEHVRKVRSI